MDISTSSTATNLRFFRIFKQWPIEQPYMWNCVSDIMNCCTVLIAIRSPSIRHNFIKHGSLNWSQNTHKYFQKHRPSTQQPQGLCKLASRLAVRVHLSLRQPLRDEIANDTDNYDLDDRGKRCDEDGRMLIHHLTSQSSLHYKRPLRGQKASRR